MEYRRLGQSPLHVSAIVFGAWAIGGWRWGGQNEQEAIEAIHAAVDLGVTSIDTAPMYGLGRSEEIVGRAVRDRRDRVQILSKFGIRWDSSQGQLHMEVPGPDGRSTRLMRNCRPNSIVEECERSLGRLQTDHIDLFQCHIPDPTTPIEEAFEAVAKLVEQGKVVAAGVSNFDVEQMEVARSVLPIAANQAAFSMLDRKIEHDLLPFCRRHGIGALAYSPLARGLLTGKFTEDYCFPPGDHRVDLPLYQRDNLRAVNAFLQALRPIADSHGATLPQLVISWTIDQPGVTAALVGIRNRRQAAENAPAATIRLSEESLEEIDSLLGALKVRQ